MQITIYINTADSRVANKSGHLTTIASLSGRPTEADSIVTPQIIVDWKPQYNRVNYAYIVDFGKYYFIKDIVVKSGGQAILYLDADDRYNWYDYYKSKTAIITRSEKIGAPTEIPDSKLPIDPNRHELLTLPILKNGAPTFAQTINQCDYVLATVGNIKETVQPNE